MSTPRSRRDVAALLRSPVPSRVDPELVSRVAAVARASQEPGRSRPQPLANRLRVVGGALAVATCTAGVAVAATLLAGPSVQAPVEQPPTSGVEDQAPERPEGEPRPAQTHPTGSGETDGARRADHAASDRPERSSSTDDAENHEELATPGTGGGRGDSGQRADRNAGPGDADERDDRDADRDGGRHERQDDPADDPADDPRDSGEDRDGSAADAGDESPGDTEADSAAGSEADSGSEPDVARAGDTGDAETG